VAIIERTQPAASPVTADESSLADFHRLAATRRSIRRFSNRPIDKPMLERLLQTAGWAPSAHNRQPWRFAVLRSGPAKHKMAVAMGEKLRADRTSDGDAADVIERDVTRSYARITQAPVVVVACVSMCDMDVYPDERRRTAERLMAVQSTAMAIQNLLLAAHFEGVGASIMCAPLFCADTVRDVLALPDDWQPQSLVLLGAKAGQAREKDRLPLSTYVRWLDDAP
jgi:coenzyme F420-0:L-glutamate ligase / coenzyme F420-1:gamma-L-glutamate ligase